MSVTAYDPNDPATWQVRARMYMLQEQPDAFQGHHYAVWVGSRLDEYRKWLGEPDPWPYHSRFDHDDFNLFLETTWRDGLADELAESAVRQIEYPF